MNIKVLTFILSIMALVANVAVISYYKNKVEQAQTALTELQAIYDDNQKMLQKYQQQITKLHIKLASANDQAEARKQQLQEVLANEQNQKWRDTPVPDDIVRLFEQRKQNDTNKADLPTNDRVSKH
ncbi:hypothetical protein NYR60_02785 [Actinobacillus genomosp. 2]|uniref:hypothetical protein n=1 Tax=Actinobacillus genomosp. 2 TaxID=230709 RepID=UPI0024420C79|nr:hypothetical protein [Actinobacillus genomosp. 2]WGE32554.1 hypothetical protein NYR60_02785 [Actinobacillus genomosp. 2]